MLTATNLVPSADEATLIHGSTGALEGVQVAPASAEVQIESAPFIPPAAATNLSPSAEAAMDDQDFWGALVALHVVPELVEMYMRPEPYIPPTAAISRVPSADDVVRGERARHACGGRSWWCAEDGRGAGRRGGGSV